MEITLGTRTAETAAVYFEKTNNEAIRAVLPQKARTVEEALALFLSEAAQKYGLKTVGAFTYTSNRPSIRVLEKNGFRMIEEFVEDGVPSQYYQLDLSQEKA